MKLVVFGLAVSSSWGNGHATLWRGLGRALARLGHHLVFFERDVPYYASHRDAVRPEGIDLRLYGDWEEERSRAALELMDADAAVVTSFCPDAAEAAGLVLDATRPLHVFYDLDTPVTLALLDRGTPPAYLGPRGLRDFDLVLSFTGGAALHALRDRLGARAVAPLYGSVDPDVHRPAPAPVEARYDLGYLGTYSPDRQPALQVLMLDPARALPDRRFVIAGSLYPRDFPWQENIWYLAHLPPQDHPGFYASARLTLNVTRGPMAAMGYCPSGRLFEAAACGAPILSDGWEGLDRFFRPGEEIIVASSTEDAIAALETGDESLRVMARRARERTLAEHTAGQRAAELLELLQHPVAVHPDTAPSGITVEI